MSCLPEYCLVVTGTWLGYLRCDIWNLFTLPVCVQVCVCHNEKKVPDKWQARQATQAVQWIPSFLRKTLNSWWPKTYGKKDMEKIWKIMGGSVLLPKIKRRQNLSGSYHNHLPPFFFFEDFGGVSTSNVPGYEWSSWQLRTCRAASVRMFDHKRERCTVCSQCTTTVDFKSFFLDEKGLIRSFPATFVWFYLEK